jgi:hypothetical protein
MRLNGGDVQRLEHIEDGLHVRLVEVTAVPRAPGVVHGAADLADMVGLGHAHRAARIGHRDRHVEMGEGLHEGAHGRAAAMVQHGAGPIQDHGLDHATGSA